MTDYSRGVIDFRAAAFESAQRLYRSLTRHRERYLRAYCAQYGISPDQLDQYELVTATKWGDDGLEVSHWMRRRSTATEGK